MASPPCCTGARHLRRMRRLDAMARLVQTVRCTACELSAAQSRVLELEAEIAMLRNGVCPDREAVDDLLAARIADRLVALTPQLAALLQLDESDKRARRNVALHSNTDEAVAFLPPTSIKRLQRGGCRPVQKTENEEPKMDAVPRANTPADGTTATAALKVAENRRQQSPVNGSDKVAPLTQTAKSGPKNALFPTRRQLQQQDVEEPKKEEKQDEEQQQPPEKESVKEAPPKAQAADGKMATAQSIPYGSVVICQPCKELGKLCMCSYSRKPSAPGATATGLATFLSTPSHRQFADTFSVTGTVPRLPPST